ncbi:hypothetical protein AWB68_07874 [Caballeronia choica]|uniref:Uncharacterized protein n=1 Tax=Caballeronia choica TaxID=326476 RepID=A0A158KXV0_9BURK|nr:hypothetical protein AWB68_07874 [Caballeronia choica]
MTISVQPNAEETLELASHFMAIVTTTAEQLQEAVDNGETPSNYFAIQAKQALLAAQIQTWVTEGIGIALDSAGQAVDAINQATTLMNNAINITKKIAVDVAVIGSFVDLAVAITSGQPQAIISKSTAFIAKLTSATA